MRALLIFVIGLCAVGFSMKCWSDGPVEGQDHSAEDKQLKSEIECDGDCKYCGKIAVKKDKKWASFWGCGCGEEPSNVGKTYTDEKKSCSKKGKESIKVADVKGHLYCCEGDKCNSAPTALYMTSSLLVLGLARLLQ